MGRLVDMLSGSAPRAAAGGTQPPATDDFWYQPAGQMTASGARVTSDNAMQETAVWACVGLLSETIASLPLVVYRRGDGNHRETDRAHPLFDLLFLAPNEDMTAFEFWEVVMLHLLLRGNFYAEKIPGRRGAVASLRILQPDYVDCEKLNGRRIYRYRDPDEPGMPARTLVQDEVLHIRNKIGRGPAGLSPIAHAREQIGLSATLQQHAAFFFQNNAQPRGVLMTDATLDNDEAFAQLRKSWNDVYGGVQNSSKVAVLDQGTTYKAISLSNEDSQFLESRKFQVNEICRWFRVPPHMVGDTEPSTAWGTGIEEMTLGFVKYSLRPWLERIEQAIMRDLFIGPWLATHFPEFNLDALLRGDFKTRMEGYVQMMNAGVGIPNEARARENLPPYEGGQYAWRPRNMAAIGDDGRAIPDQNADRRAGTDDRRARGISTLVDPLGRPLSLEAR